MKRLIGLLIGIVLSSYATAQEKPNICVPDSVGTYIIEELIVKDHLAFEVVRQDSIITVLEVEVNGLRQKVIIYQTEKKEYQEMISRLNEIIKIRNAEIADLRSENKKIRFRAVKIIVPLIGVIVIETILLMFK